MARFLCKTLALLIIIIVALDEGCGLPLSRQAEAAAESPQPHRVRTKRCSCNSWDDKECIYFCHLDIIWVNTPSKILPYGLGSPLSRRRRSANRCQCASPNDTTCSDFCHDSSDRPKADDTDSAVKSTRLSSNKLLRYLRSVVKSNAVLAKTIPSKANPAKVKQLKNWTIR